MCFVTLSRLFTIHFKRQIYKRFNVLCCHTVTFVQSLFHGYTLNRFKVFSLKNMLKIITKKIGWTDLKIIIQKSVKRLDCKNQENKTEIVRWSDNLTVRVFDCLMVGLSECLTVWQPECQSVWPSDKLTVRVSDHLTNWLSECLTIWQADCQSVWPSDKLTVSQHQHWCAWYLAMLWTLRL